MARLYNHGHKVADLNKVGFTTYRLMSDDKWMKSKRRRGWKMAHFKDQTNPLAYLLNQGFTATIYDAEKYATYNVPVTPPAPPQPSPDEEELNKMISTGLTYRQAKRLIQIRRIMSKLDDEARKIVNATPDERQNSVECYADDRSYELAELMADSWGSWEDIIQDRMMAKEEEENIVCCNKCGQVHDGELCPSQY